MAEMTSVDQQQGSGCGCGSECCASGVPIADVRAATGCCESTCCGESATTKEITEPGVVELTRGNPLPVAIIGAGPVGVAAAHVLARGETPLVLEAGAAVGASIRKWGHVRLFSP